MPTYQRRYFLGLLTKNRIETAEHQEKLNEQSKSRGSKGSRQTTVSGQALKNKFKNGEIPTS